MFHLRLGNALLLKGVSNALFFFFFSFGTLKIIEHMFD